MGATDNDTGANSDLTYEFVTNDDRIAIHSADGVVTVAKEAEFTPNESISLYVVVHDKGTPQLTSAEQAAVKVGRSIRTLVDKQTF